MKKKLILSIVIGAICYIAMALAILLFFQSCSATKSKSSSTDKTASTQKVDSGTVKKETNTSTNQNEWWREVLKFQQPAKDSNVINVYNSNPQPYVIIREGGKQSSQNESSKFDSSWGERIAELTRIVEASTKKKEETVLDAWQIIGICIGGSLVLGVLLIIGIKLLKPKFL
jgi:hypothetical protein